MSMPVYIYIILVNGNISSDGWFEEADLAECKRVAERYKANYTVQIKKIRNYTIDLT